ncbi:hypothetical protein JW916_14970 [Candidatus Sumerlaeota bacterium]|nr:hypothetical protein [Candidatus Sumerlaeota bacterium]
MKSKTSITLSKPLLHGIEERSAEFKSRSDFIEAAVEHFIAYLDRRQVEQKDAEILDKRADALNREAQDVLGYQVPL